MLAEYNNNPFASRHLRQTARYCGLSFQDFVPSDFGMSMLCNKSQKKTPENRSFPGKKDNFFIAC